MHDGMVDFASTRRRILGGILTGQPVVVPVRVKPTSSILSPPIPSTVSGP